MDKQVNLKNDEVRKVFSERLKKFKAHHTYSVFKLKIESDSSNPFFGLDGYSLNKKLEEIVENNIHLSKVEEAFDYGFGGILNIVFFIPYQDYRLYFAIDIGKLVLINLYKEDENLNNLGYLEKFLISPKQSSEMRKWSKNISFMGEYFYLINTYEAFYEFSKTQSDFRTEPNRNLNEIFWRDFNLYINNKQGLGSYEVIQVGNVIIICNFNYGEQVNQLAKVY